MTDQEINEAVARKLGWDKMHPCQRHLSKKVRADFYIAGPPPDYCHSIEAAWEICDFVKQVHPEWQVSLFCVDKDWACIFGTAEKHYAEYADTAPMAICLAFLKLK